MQTGFERLEPYAGKLARTVLRGAWLSNEPCLPDTITSQIQSKEGWIKHPLDEQLRSKAPNQKLRTIPVRMIFNDPELNLRAEYSLFDRQTGRPICVGNGETCQRLTNQGIEQHPCTSPDLCTLAQGGNCKPYGRLHVNLDESDELGTFIFRTTGFNLSLIHISEPTRPVCSSRMPSSA